MTISRDRLLRLLPAAWFGVVVTAIVAPWWLRPGYVWLLDGVWGPHRPLDWGAPDQQVFWHALIQILNWAITPAAAQKLLLSLTLLAVGLGGYYLARRWLPRSWALASGTLYLLSPFVYERLLGGQWLVLAGYAWLPAVVVFLWEVLESQGQRGAWRLALSLAIYPLISLHLSFIAVWLAIGIVLTHVIIVRPAWMRSIRTAQWVVMTAVIGVVINSFWLMRLRAPDGGSFGSIDFTTFRTAADDQLGVWGNVISLYGFWYGETFLQPKMFLGPAWFVLGMIIVALALAGLVWAVRRRHTVGAGLGLAAVIAIVLAAGYSSPLTRPLTDALMQYLPGYSGLRDTAKLLAVPALAYAVLAPLGMRWAVQNFSLGRAATGSAVAALIMIAAVSVTGIWGGFGGQVPVADYPAGWYAVRERLNAHPDAAVVVLPWRGYLRLDFAGNAFVAQPAPVFFTQPMLIGRSLDNTQYDIQNATELDRLNLALLSGRLRLSAWTNELAYQKATHVVLFKTDDWAAYGGRLWSLPVEYEDDSIVLYTL